MREVEKSLRRITTFSKIKSLPIIIFNVLKINAK